MRCIPETSPDDPVKHRGIGAWSGMVLKGGLTILLLWLTLRRVPLAGMGAAFLNLDWGLASLSILLFVPATGLAESARLQWSGAWLALPQPGYRAWLLVYLESRPFFLLLPAAVGSEAIIWLRLRQHGWDNSASGFVILAGRIWGAGVWGLGAAIALASFQGFGMILAASSAVLIRPGFWVGSAGGLLLISASLPGWLARRHGWSIRSDSVRILGTLILTVGCAAIAVGTAWIAARAAGLPFTIIQIMGLLAFFNFSMLLPISLGGFGLQEAIILFLGRSLGFAPQPLLAFSALLHIQRLVLSGVGLGCFLRGQRKTAPEGSISGHSSTTTQP